MPSFQDIRLWIVLPLIFVACSGPAPKVVVEDDVAAPLASPFTSGTYLLANEVGLVLVSLDSGQADSIGQGSRLVYAAADPTRAFSVVATTDGSVSRLYLIDLKANTSSELHHGPPDLVYSAAWSPDGKEVAFGYYQPAIVNDRPAQGAGDIEIANVVDGSISRLGCSASREVILWSNPDQVVVRATDNLYRVSRANCTTIQTVDVRRWHHVTPSPAGSRLAYIYRELAFNRNTREYEPDSALFVVGTPGADGFKAAGDRYRPRNMAWSPDGSELAFDVLIDPEGTQRAVAVYNIEQVQTVYASEPQPGEPSQTHPAWDPTGSRISYLADGKRLVVKTLDVVFDKEIAVGGSPASRLVGWLSETTLMVEDTSRRLWLYDLRSDRTELVGVGTAVVL